MKRHLVLRLYPRAWRERYGEELSAQLESQRPLRIGVVADLVRGALDAHLHPLRRDNSTLRISSLDRRTIAARAALVWSPVAAVGAAAVLLLIDCWEGHGYMIWWLYGSGTPVVGGITLEWYRLPTSPPGAFPSGPQVTLAPYDGSSWVRFVPSDQLYDLALHFAVLAVAFAGALIFAALARKALRASEPSVS
jgi:hypothetical protein